jgi:cysteine synthase
VAALGALLDLEVTVVAGSSITPEHRALIEAAGASLILTGDGHSDRIREAARIAAERGAFFLNQYENPANPLTHRDWSAPEVSAQHPACDAVFVCASSGGTASGFAMHAAQAVSRAALVVVDPRSSHVLVPGEDTPSPIHISGFGSEARSSFASSFAGAEMVRTSEREAFAIQRAMAGALGIDLGFSSAGIVAGAFSWLGRKSEPQQVVCVCPDSGQRYASAPPFATEALARWFPDLTAAIAAEADALHQTIASVERIPFSSADDAERVATSVRA